MKVLLVQRGVYSQTHAVCGKSGKTYGMAVHLPQYAGAVYELSLEDYTKDADDLVGNMAPAQQWVPVFLNNGTSVVPAVPPPAAPTPPLKGVDERVGGGPPPETVPDDDGVIEVPSSTCYVGSPAEEEAATTGATSGLRVETPVPVPAFPKKTQPVGSIPTPPNPPLTPPVASVDAKPDTGPKLPVAELIRNEVKNAVGELKGELVKSIKEVLSLAGPIPKPRPKKKVATGELTPMQKLQKDAKDLGINPFQKSKMQLQAEIDEKLAETSS